jgi:Lipase (class 3)
MSLLLFGIVLVLVTTMSGSAFVITSSSSSSSTCRHSLSKLILKPQPHPLPQHLFSAAASDTADTSASDFDPDLLLGGKFKVKSKFDLETALYCSGLAFDSYVEPPSNSSRWERGSRGMDVAFLSAAYTRNLYKGLVQITPLQALGLPDEDDTIEGIATGGGCDAYLVVAALEGDWKDDVQRLDREMYHEGVRDLSGAAHVGRSSTAWSNVDAAKSQQALRTTGKALPYHVKSNWGRAGQAIWTPDEQPFYLYLQDPASARLVFSIMDDDLIGEGSVVGSAHKRLTELIPEAKLSQQAYVDQLKGQVLAQVQQQQQQQISQGGDWTSLLDSDNSDLAKVKLGARTWQGGIKMTSKPKKKDKNSQVAMGVAAGAAVAGPLGAAVGGVMASMYEGEVRGRMELKISYLPLPQTNVARQRYHVLGGLPGIYWGDLYQKYTTAATSTAPTIMLPANDNDNNNNIDNTNSHSHSSMPRLRRVNDLEQCFFIKHSVTGGCCVVYRSLHERILVVSFRGTCEPKDLVTDAKLVQQAWVSGEDSSLPGVAKVHAGFRTSMESISRRLKELVLAAVAPGEQISQYDMLVTGHSLGGALSTLFTADIGEYGIDAGRALPQLAPSEPWWKSITKTFMGQEARDSSGNTGPPRPKSLRMYNFGSPRVGNGVFAKQFDALLQDGRVDAAYRMVNGDDIVTRVPRTTSPLGVEYEHVGSTVMVSKESAPEGGAVAPALWIEGESDESKCPVRDMDFVLNSPIAEGTLLGDLLSATATATNETDQKDVFGRFSTMASKWSERVKNIKASDLASIIGIDREFSEREFKIIESFAKGRALANHLEDDYYAAMGRASGFRAIVGEEITPLSSTGDEKLA